MKKVLCLILTLCTILSLCACGGKAYDKEKLEAATEQAAFGFYYYYGRGLFPTQTTNPSNIDLTYKSVKKVSDNTYSVTGNYEVTFDNGHSESGTYKATVEVKNDNYLCSNFNGAEMFNGVVPAF